MRPMLLFFLGMNLFSQSIEEAWQAALENSPEISNLLLERQTLLAEQGAAWRDFLPSITFGMGLNRSSQLFTPESTPEGNRWSLRTSLDLRWGGSWEYQEMQKTRELSWRSWLVDLQKTYLGILLLDLTSPWPARVKTPDMAGWGERLETNPGVARAVIDQEESVLTRGLRVASLLGPTLSISTGANLTQSKLFSGNLDSSDALSLGLSLSVPLDSYLPGGSAALGLDRLEASEKKNENLHEAARTDAKIQLLAYKLDIAVLGACCA